MASTLKVNRIETPDGLGNISFAQPVSGDGAQLTNLNIAGSNLTNIPAAELVGTIATGVDGSGLINVVSTPADDSVTGAKIDLSLVAGDIIYSDATDSIERLPKGTDGEVLTLASGVPSWATAGGGSATPVLWVNNTANLTCANGTPTLMAMDNETLDTQNAWDTTTNLFTPSAGYYWFKIQVVWSAGFGATSVYSAVYLYKNGSSVMQATINQANKVGGQGSIFQYANGTDTFGAYAQQNTGSNQDVQAAIDQSFFQAMKIS